MRPFPGRTRAARQSAHAPTGTAPIPARTLNPLLCPPDMTLPAPTYDLVLLLDARVEEGVRTKILDDTRAAIAAAGEVVNEDDWGDRALAYPIERHADAEYRLLQFHASTPQLLSDLERTLRITDGVLRFRIVKLKPGTPEAPDMRSGAAAAPRQAEPAHSAPPPPTEAPPEVAVGEPA